MRFDCDADFDALLAISSNSSRQMMCQCIAHFAHTVARGSERAAAVLRESPAREVAERWRLEAKRMAVIYSRDLRKTSAD